MSDATEAGGKIDYAEVMRRLPHRYPFLLVDKAEDFVPRTSIVGIKNVTHNEPFFPGHFPIDPVMPGVLIVEAMAQTGALLMSKTLDVAVADKVIMFMSIDGVRFRKPARPGDQLRMEVKVIKARGDARIRVEGLSACDWVLIDTGDIIVHVFRPDVRDFYNLEKMWQAEIPPDASRSDPSQH